MAGTAQVGFVGKRPGLKIEPIPEKENPEKAKYEKMWAIADYRKVAPGEHAAQHFLQLVGPKAGDEVIDFGCGTGRGALGLWVFGGMKVTMVDIASNCLDPDLVLGIENNPDKLSFIEHDLTKPLELEQPKKYGYCTDVMEHIPEEQVDAVLKTILNAAEKVFFRISTTNDVMGPKHIGEHLHLTVKDYTWWAKKFLDHEVTILDSARHSGAVDFYVTGWTSTLPQGKLNTEEEQILNNIRTNAKWPCHEVQRHDEQPNAEIMLLAGGPSLNDFEEEIIANHKAGMPVVTVNNTYKWAQERGIHNVNQCMIDARAFNKRFCEPVRDDCYYFIATQCDPSVFEMLPHDRTFFWHVNTNPDVVDLTAELYPDHLFCSGGCTVALRAIVLMRVLGFRKMHIYGMDSCLINEEHHAYEQKENDISVPPIPMIVGDRKFMCDPWMAYQAHDFVGMIKKLGDEFQLDIKGDGLLAYLMKSGAALPDLEET